MVHPHYFLKSNLGKFLFAISLLLLLYISNQERVQTQGRSSFMHKFSKEGETKEMPMLNFMIGSRPPRCENRCLKCGHCEAVQIPVTPHEKIPAVDSIMSKNARVDESNYKPMNWKCKCGDFIFNP